MSEKRRFHPLALVIYLFNNIKAFFFIFIALFFQTKTGEGVSWLLIGGFALVLTIFAMVRYFSEYYQISPEKVVIYKGVFRKSETDIFYERMQTIKERQWFFFQPFHVTQVLIETAGGGANKAEASLVAVPEALLSQIEGYRNSVSKQGGNEALVAELAEDNDRVDSQTPVVATTESPEYIYQVTNQQIFWFGITDLSMLFAAFTILVFIQELVPEGWIDRAADLSVNLLKAGWLMVLAFGAVILLILMVFSLVKNFLQYYNFQVSRTGDTLTIESGLLERRVQKIPLAKLQGIKINQQLLRKVLGLSSVQLLLAGGQETEGESGESKALYFLPIIQEKELYGVLDFLLPDWDFNQPAIQYVSRGKLFYFWRWPVLIMVPATLAAFFVHPAAGGVMTLVTVVALVASFLDCHYQGYSLQSEKRLCIQNFAVITKTLTFVERPKIQAFAEKSSIWLYPKQIGHVALTVKEGTGNLQLHLRFIDYAAVEELKHFFRRK